MCPAAGPPHLRVHLQAEVDGAAAGIRHHHVARVVHVGPAVGGGGGKAAPGQGAGSSPQAGATHGASGKAQGQAAGSSHTAAARPCSSSQRIMRSCMLAAGGGGSTLSDLPPDGVRQRARLLRPRQHLACLDGVHTHGAHPVREHHPHSAHQEVPVCHHRGQACRWRTVVRAAVTRNGKGEGQGVGWAAGRGSGACGAR
jgi:hypothetical protein